MTITIQGGWWAVLAVVIAGLVSLAVWLVKIYIPKKIESAVKHRYDLELEKFKHDLTITATERNLRFSHVYSKTAEVLLDYYKKMTDSFGHVTFMLYEIEPVDGLQDDAKYKRRAEVILIAKDYTTFHANHRLYFPPECAEIIEEALRLFTELLDLAGQQKTAFVTDRRNFPLVLETTRIEGKRVELEYLRLLPNITKELQQALGIGPLKASEDAQR